MIYELYSFETDPISGAPQSFHYTSLAHAETVGGVQYTPCALSRTGFVDDGSLTGMSTQISMPVDDPLVSQYRREMRPISVSIGRWQGGSVKPVLKGELCKLRISQGTATFTTTPPFFFRRRGRGSCRAPG